MWVCPKCGRSFGKVNQGHYCGEKPKTVDEYILAQDEEVRGYLEIVRGAIREALPEVEEKISWSMPTYWKKHNILHFAAHKKHIGFYAGPEAVVEFSERLAKYKTSKGAIHFLYSEPIPVELIGDIAKWCYVTGNHA